uniref:Uncharacterized protein n=1 Tax=viral metagenome TaxID=1070528 RepID=A0A6C0JNJ3_9ZZZZ
MSQSDYIKYKKINTVLSVDASTNFLPVLNSQEYSDYKEFVLENTIQNSKTIFGRITPSISQVVLGMDKKKTLVQNMGTTLTNCPSFLLCNNTNKRLNRVPLSTVYSNPTPQPLNWMQTKNASWQKSACKCILNSRRTNTNICSCKLGV